MKRMAKEKGFSVTCTEDEDEFEREKLRNFDVVMFLLTTGDVLDRDHEESMEAFIRAGGGYVGVHSASDTEYEWPWYAGLVGAYFLSHPAQQEADIIIEERGHPTTNYLPDKWRRFDEWYDFRANPRANVKVLASIDEKSYKNGRMNGDHPVMWYHQYDGGRAWYTAMGHTNESYSDAHFMESLYQGILWSAQGKRPLGAVSLRKPDLNGSETWTDDGIDVINNGPKGNAAHLVSKNEYGDVHAHVEFKLPKNSNSGVYLQGRYEIQIFGSNDKELKDLTSADCGGVYERWKDNKGYEGVPPSRQAIRKAGEWNVYDIVFRAPRFDSKGKKTENARFVEVRLNGIVIQKDIAVTGPTRASMWEDEKPTGPLMLQGDHGPIAYRNVWMRPLKL